MTAVLSPLINDEFAHASTVGKFFSNAEIKTIQSLEKREQPPIGFPGESCKTNLFFGFFFDGTKNNYKLAEASKSHSNVARLYDCYPGLSVPGILPTSTDWQHNSSRYTHFFKVYIPGVASPFPQVDDSGEGLQLMRGAATGALGEQRIIWALLQAINNVHRFFLKTPLIQPSETDSFLRQIVLNKDARRLMEEKDWKGAPVANKEISSRARREFEKLLLDLHSAVAKHWPDPKTNKPTKVDPAIVTKIYVSIFGFSRGATQARAFTNWLHSLCRLDARLRGQAGSMSLGGFEVQFDFLGLFDTVASVGLGNTLGNSIPGRLLDGHGAWADAEDSLRVPAGVKCLHLVAAHEVRRSFPVDSISVKGQLADSCEEIVVPGVHSDIGCGYCPGEQGRGRDADGADMLARIPLLMMYKTARLNGVPLKLELANGQAQSRFALKPEAIKAFNAYIATCRETNGPIHRIMREQTRKYIEWRLFRRIHGKNSIQSTDSFLRASAFEQNDLYSASQEFEDELKIFVAWLKEKGVQFRPAVQPAGFYNDHHAEWEEIASWWEKGPSPCAAVLELFDNYVHDSRAWFKLIPNNPDNEKDAHAQLASWIQRRKAVRIHNEMRPNLHGRGNSMYRMQATDGLSEDELRAVAEYEKTGKIPRMTTRGREPFDSSWASWGLSGRAGYLRFRKIYGGWDSELLS